MTVARLWIEPETLVEQKRGQLEVPSITDILTSCETVDQYKTVMSSLFRDDVFYDHCIECNDIVELETKYYILTVPFEVQKKFGLPYIHDTFVFTSGLCDPCFPEVMERTRKEIAQRKNLEYIANSA